MLDLLERECLEGIVDPVTHIHIHSHTHTHIHTHTLAVARARKTRHTRPLTKHSPAAKSLRLAWRSLFFGPPQETAPHMLPQ